MKALGIGANIMSLGGIAIAVGAMIDAAIVMIENAHKHLERAPPGKPRVEVLIEAASEVGPALFFCLLIITVSFLPIFTLESQEGRLFGPLAFTKTFAMAAAALLSVTLVPALMVLFVRGRIVPEHREPGEPRCSSGSTGRSSRGVLRARIADDPARRGRAGGDSLAGPRSSAPSSCPTLDEGTLLYMPTTLPGISVTKAGELLQTQDRIIKSFPEVASVYGKAGRADDRDRPGADRDDRDHHQPEAEGRMAAGRHRSTACKAEMDKALQFPGVSNAWTHADPRPHRHALDRHPHAGRHQGLRHRPRARWRGVARAGRGRRSRPCPARRAPTPSGSSAATSSTSRPTARRSPATG